eukprot:CAMPEP_0202695896 /NCGR_PEP_ID=MMETSP1385-20130828/9342_1 /ASSEMBLY_ACC=CAM_ASM_000861 /TAXON_ID=933848 /ORGANISM="Elphidium margaritaceum" /LENGTH=402 /DNA_ID=CAMNT_0049351977 /DNA_START=22 /DNA_END=1230 /DNA_ORIENTATION=+
MASSVDANNDFLPLSFFNNHPFATPTKRICQPAHIATFINSSSHKKLLKFLKDLGDSVVGKTLTEEVEVSSTTTKVLAMLDTLKSWAIDIPPCQIQTRYGNKAYRTWRDKIQQQSKQLLMGLLPQQWTVPQSQSESQKSEQKSSDAAQHSILQGILCELRGYLLQSFGDYTRIDYGSGHELTFVCFLLILAELRLFKRTDFAAIVLRIFNRYLLLMRFIQTRYALEPAGTKGVWGLDDYQFLSFYFGAAQLVDHASIKPKDILNESVLQTYVPQYMYLSCVHFIVEMKTGPFAEHSPLLNDISAVPLWSKVRSGLLKMYQDDVLKKLPVVQHFLFGSIITIDLPAPDKNANADTEKAEILKRKQALIAKLNAKNPKVQQEAAQTAQNSKSNDMPVTKAPWAK